jgi:hypothetical protein
VTRLLAAGYRVRCLARSPQKLAAARDHLSQLGCQVGHKFSSCQPNVVFSCEAGAYAIASSVCNTELSSL